MIHIVLVRISIAMIKHHDGKKVGEEKVAFVLQFDYYSRKLRTGIWGRQRCRNHEKLLIIALLSLFSYITEDHYSRNNDSHCELHPPRSNTNENKS